MLLKTNDLNIALTKALNGASCNKMLPLTFLCEIQAVSTDETASITVTTTDGSNYLQVEVPTKAMQPGGTCHAVVNIETLAHLVGLLTAEEVTLEVSDTALTVISANGTYSLELPVGDDGTPIKYPKPFASFKAEEETEISEDSYTDVLKMNSVALSDIKTDAIYTCYYFGDTVLTSDSFKICCTEKKCTQTPVLLHRDMVKLLSLCSGPVKLQRSAKNEVMFTGNGVLIYGKCSPNIEKFNVNIINQLLDMEFAYNVELNRDSVIKALSRMSLMVSPFDKNTVRLSVSSAGFVRIANKQGTSTEDIKVSSFTNAEEDAPKPYTCLIDANLLKEQISAQNGQFITLGYGSTKAIRMDCNDTVQILGLVSD